jgi:hypothetical protein
MSKRYIRDLCEKLSRFPQSFGGKMVASITAKEIDAWLRSLPVGPTTRNNFRRVLVTFFSHAISLGYAGKNPAGDTAKAKEADAPPGILTVPQAARLLEKLFTLPSAVCGRRPLCRSASRRIGAPRLERCSLRPGSTYRSHRGQIQDGAATLREDPAEPA